MSALLTPRRALHPRRDMPRGPMQQAALFGAAPAATAEPVGAAASATAPEAASVRRHGPTLDELVAGAWEGLLAGAPAACIACGSTMTPRHSAGAGVVGGRCGGCGSTLG